MTEELPAQIESYLLTRHGWVSAAELCATFGTRDRALRALGRRPGLCSEFAISGDKGFKHVARATDTEFDRACKRMRNHGVGELLRIGKLRRRRRAMLTVRPPLTFERATGQALLLT